MDERGQRLPLPVAMSDSRLRVLREVLLSRDKGATAEELAAALGVSRTAVTQQLVCLERDGLVVRNGRRATGGRPGRTYALTDAGRETFPRHYALFAASLLRHAGDLFGEEGLAALLDRMAAEVAAGARPRLEGKSGAERRAEVVSILNELGYEAVVAPDGAIEAVNCVFSRVARESRTACRFDVVLLGSLLGEDVAQTSCLADGEGCCRFHTR